MSAPNIVGINDSDGSYIQPLPEEYLSGYVEPVKTRSQLLKSKRNAPSGGDNTYGIGPSTPPVQNQQFEQTDLTTTINQQTGIAYLNKADYTGLPMARWNDIPYRKRKGSFKAGIVAFHQTGISRVDFWINRDPNSSQITTPYYTAKGMEFNESSSTNEYCVIINVNQLLPGLHQISARVHSNAGTYVDMIWGSTSTMNNTSFAMPLANGSPGTFFNIFKDFWNDTNVTATVDNKFGNFRGSWAKAINYQVNDIVSVGINNPYYAIAKNSHISEEIDFTPIGGFPAPHEFHSSKNPDGLWEPMRTKGSINCLPFVVENESSPTNIVVYVDPINGNDDTGVLDDSSHPFKTITKLIGNPKVTEYRIMNEGIVEITYPTNGDNNVISGPKNNSYVLIQADPGKIASGMMKVENVKLNLKRLNAGFFLFRNICFDAAICRSNNAAYMVWLDRCLITTSVSGNAPSYGLFNNAEIYITNCVTDRGFQTYGACKLVRNSIAYYNIGDLHGSPGLVVNVRSKNLTYTLDENYTIHQDCVQFYNYSHNKIIYNLHSENTNAQNILANSGLFEEIAIVNYVADNSTDESASSQTGSLTAPYRNIFIAHTTILNKTNQYFRADGIGTNGAVDPLAFRCETMTGNLVINSIFPSTSSHADTLGTDNYPKSLRFINCVLPNCFENNLEWRLETSFLTNCLTETDNDSDYVYGTVSVVTKAATEAGGDKEDNADHQYSDTDTSINIDFEASGLKYYPDIEKRALKIFGNPSIGNDIGSIPLTGLAPWNGHLLRSAEPSVSLNKWSVSNPTTCEIFPTNRICNVSNATFTQFRSSYSNDDILPNPHTYTVTSYPTAIKMIDGRDNGNTFQNTLSITADTKGEFNNFFRNLKIYIPTSAAATANNGPAKSIVRGLQSLVGDSITPSGYLLLGITSTTQSVVATITKNVAGFAGISAMEDYVSQFPIPGLHNFGRVSGLPTSYGESGYGYDYHIITDGITLNDYLPTEGPGSFNSVGYDINGNPTETWSWMGDDALTSFNSATTLANKRLKRLSYIGPSPSDVFGFIPRVVLGITGISGGIPFYFDTNGQYFAGNFVGSTLGITFDSSNSYGYRWLFEYKFKFEQDNQDNWIYSSEQEFQREKNNVDLYLRDINNYWKSLNKFRIITSRIHTVNPYYNWMSTNYMDVDFKIGNLPTAIINIRNNFPYVVSGETIDINNAVAFVDGDIQSRNWTLNDVVVSTDETYTPPVFTNGIVPNSVNLNMFLTRGYTLEGITFNGGSNFSSWVLPDKTLAFYVSGAASTNSRANWKLITGTNNNDTDVILGGKPWENEEGQHWLKGSNVSMINLEQASVGGTMCQIILQFKNDVDRTQFKNNYGAGITAGNFRLTVMNTPHINNSIYFHQYNGPGGITRPYAKEFSLKNPTWTGSSSSATFKLYETSGETAYSGLCGSNSGQFAFKNYQWFNFKNPNGPLQFANRSLQTCTTTKYISPGLSGSDLNSGDSISAPYKTMTKAMAQSQKDGCIFCGPGVYNIEQGAGYTRASGKIIGMIGFAGVTSGLKIMSYDESDPAKFKGSIGHNLLPISEVSLQQINPAYSGSVRGFTLNDKLKSATEYGLAGRDFRDRVQDIYLFETKSNEIQPISSEGIPTSPSILHFGAARAENPTLAVNEWKTTFAHWFPAKNTINNANTGQIYQWYSGFCGAYLGGTYTSVCYGISGATQNNFIYNLIKEKTPSPYWASSSAATSFWKDTVLYFHGGPNNDLLNSKIIGVDIDSTKVYMYNLSIPSYGFPAGLSLPIQGQTMFRYALTQEMTIANHPYWINFPGQYTLRGNTGMYMPVNILPGASGQISIPYYDNIIVTNNSNQTTISNLHMGECVAWGIDSNTSGNTQRGLTLTGNAIQDCGYGGMAISITNEPSRNLPNLPTMINRNYVTRTQYRPISISNNSGATLQPMVRAEWNTVYNWFERTGLYAQGVSGGIFKGNTVVSHADAVHGNGMAFYVNCRNLVIDSNFVYMPKNITVAINDVYGNDAGNNKWEIKNNVCIGQAFEWRDKFVCGACFTNNIVSALSLYQVDVKNSGESPSEIAEATYWKEICTRRVIRNNIIGSMGNGFFAPVNGTGGTYSPMWWARATGGDNQYIFRDNIIGNVQTNLMGEYVLNNNGIPTYGPYGENKALCQENNIGVMQFINGNTTSGITLFYKGLLADVNTDIHTIDVSTNIFGYANNNDSFFPSSTAQIFRGDNAVPPMRTTQQGIGLDYSTTTSKRWRTYADRYAGLNYEYDEEGNVVKLPKTHIWDWTLRQENTALIPAINFGSINSTEDTHGIYVNGINMLDGATMAWPSDKISARAKMYINNDIIGTTLTHEIGLFKWTNGTNNYTNIDGSDYTYPSLDPTLMNIGSYKNMGGRKIYSVASVPSYPSIPVSTVGPITYHPYKFGDMIFVNTYIGLLPDNKIYCVNQFNGGVNMHGDYGQYLSKTHWLTKYPEYRTGALNGSQSTGTTIQQASSSDTKTQTLVFVFVPGVGESIFECNSKATLFKNRLNSGNWETPAWSSIGITGGLRLVIHSGFDFEQYKNSAGVTITVAPTYPLIFKTKEPFTVGETSSETKRTVTAKIGNISNPSAWYLQGGSSISHPDFRITIVPGLTGPIVTGTKTQAGSIPTPAPTVESIAKNESRMTDTNNG